MIKVSEQEYKLLNNFAAHASLLIAQMTQQVSNSPLITPPIFLAKGDKE